MVLLAALFSCRAVLFAPFDLPLWHFTAVAFCFAGPEIWKSTETLKSTGILRSTLILKSTGILRSTLNLKSAGNLNTPGIFKSAGNLGPARSAKASAKRAARAIQSSVEKLLGKLPKGRPPREMQTPQPLPQTWRDRQDCACHMKEPRVLPELVVKTMRPLG